MPQCYDDMPECAALTRRLHATASRATAVVNPTVAVVDPTASRATAVVHPAVARVHAEVPCKSGTVDCGRNKSPSNACDQPQAASCCCPGEPRYDLGLDLSTLIDETKS